MSTRPHTPWRPLAALVGGVALLATAAPALAATLDDWEPTGIQFVNADCARNEYVIQSTITGTTDDVGGFDKVRVSVWDDGDEMDHQVVEVPVGETVENTTFLSFLGTYGSGAPGVGLEIQEADADGEASGALDVIDPYYPTDEEGPCEFNVERIGGADRVETAALLAQRFIMADTVVIVTSRDFPDALTAAPLANQLAGPLLLTHPGHLPSATAAEITRLQPSSIIIVGGDTAVQPEVEAALADVAPPGASVTRVAGSDRYETAVAVAAQITQDSSQQMYLATGEDFPDALVLSALASRESAPLVLAQAEHLPAATADFLAATSYDDLYAAGGTAVLSDPVVDDAAALQAATAHRFAGTDRYETASLVLQEFPPEGEVLVATGETFPDALTAVPVAGRTGAGIALAQTDHVPASAMTEIQRLTTGFSFPLVTIVGGEVALSETVHDELLELFGTAGESETLPETVLESNVAH